MALKYGYVAKKSKTWYKSWSERFYVLSNIGLIYMEKPEDKDVKLFPFMDFNVVEIPQKKYNRQWVFTLTTHKGGNTDMVL